MNMSLICDLCLLEAMRLSVKGGGGLQPLRKRSGVLADILQNISPVFQTNGYRFLASHRLRVKHCVAK